jgi:5-(carboxyamino)imidazole ribonucleotide mutase
MPDVEIIIGSTSDQPKIESSGMLEILKAMGVSYRVSAVSAHRHPEDLESLCLCSDSKVFIGIAGMSAALPGAIAALTNRQSPVLGVALSSNGNEYHHQAAVHSMMCMPPGVPVNFCGSDKPGLVNAAIAACQIIGVDSKPTAVKLAAWIEKKTKPAKIGVLSSDDPTEP